MSGMGGLRMDEGKPFVHGPTTMGEADIGLHSFWYKPMFDRAAGEPSVDRDWGIHCNADALANLAAEIANRMNAKGMEDIEMLALDLAFLFGFDHEYFHHRVDSGITAHTLRTHAQTGSMPPSYGDYDEFHDSISTAREGIDWWMLTEETLANAHIAMDPTRLGGLKDAFIEYGLLPEPGDRSRGPFAQWRHVAADPRIFQCLSHHTWLQILTGELDPLGVMASLEAIAHEGGLDAAFDEFVDTIVEACEQAPVDEDSVPDRILGQNGSEHLFAMGGFSDGMLRRLEVPLHFHGGEGGRMTERYGPDNPDWPYAIIENLYDRLGSFGVGPVDPWGADDPFTSLA
jgi:hypothetical protein